MLEVAKGRLKDFNSPNLANTVWAFATISHESPVPFDAIAGLAKSRLKDFKFQALVNTVWAFATVGHGRQCF